jgi:transcriptional regulator with XRE-family HTH domain
MPRRQIPEPLSLKVGQRIAELCRAQNLTLEGLANRIGTGKGHVSNIVRGLALIKIDTLARFAEGLGVHPGVLLAFPEENDRDALVDQIGRLSPEECADYAAKLNGRRRAPAHRATKKAARMASSSRGLRVVSSR